MYGTHVNTSFPRRWCLARRPGWYACSIKAGARGLLACSVFAGTTLRLLRARSRRLVETALVSLCGRCASWVLLYQKKFLKNQYLHMVLDVAYQVQHISRTAVCHSHVLFLLVILKIGSSFVHVCPFCFEAICCCTVHG